jgi:hypothetical protein
MDFLPFIPLTGVVLETGPYETWTLSIQFFGSTKLIIAEGFIHNLANYDIHLRHKYVVKCNFVAKVRLNSLKNCSISDANL